MRVNKVAGFFWISFNFVIMASIRIFPLNFGEYPWLTTNALSVFLMSGQIFGFSALFFYTGFAVMYERLVSIYVRRDNFNILIFIIRTYLYFLVLMVCITAIMVSLFPFLGDGPLFPLVAQAFFINNCKQYWWTNLLLINNFYPWKPVD